VSRSTLDPDTHLTLYEIFREAVTAPALLAVPAVTWRSG
jgi:hypothetical protein